MPDYSMTLPIPKVVNFVTNAVFFFHCLTCMSYLTELSREEMELVNLF